jgi:hypothetical protein
MSTSKFDLRIAIIGSGTIGSSFAALHLSNQHKEVQVVIYDPRPDMKDYIEATLPGKPEFPRILRLFKAENSCRVFGRGFSECKIIALLGASRYCTFSSICSNSSGHYPGTGPRKRRGQAGPVAAD